jgi:hypothetical protein
VSRAAVYRCPAEPSAEPIASAARKVSIMTLPRSPGLALVVLLVLSVAGCAVTNPGASVPSASEAAPSISIRIGPDGPELRDDAVVALQAYGAEHADEYAGLYVDEQSQSSFVMLFTGHLEEHAAALAEIWPRVTVRGARFSEAALTAVLEGMDLQAMAADGIEPLSAGLDTVNNRVTLDVKSDDPTLEARLELRYGGMVEVTVHPMPPDEWANATQGDGWRLLAAGEARDDAYTVRAATEEAGWHEMWAAIGLGGDAPAVDLADEVVVSFGHGVGSSCPDLRLDAVEVGSLVFSRTSDPMAPRNCTDDLAGAAVFVVALEREALPDDGFTLQLGPERVTGGGAFTEVIDVPLP